jgi:hypothetical protein
MQKLPNVCPTLSLTKMWILYTVRDSADHTYKDDVKWFKEHPKRSHVIRRACGNEFREIDAWVGLDGGILFPPPLWVAVMRSPDGNHMVLPVYRGAAFFPVDTRTMASYATVDGDDAIRLLYSQMNDLGGVNVIELANYCAKLSEAMNQSPSQDEKNAVN